VGYSAQALQARATVLRSAMETLVAPAARRAYDERLRLGDVTEEVPAEFVAGTLIVLQEAGEARAVVSAGTSWLSAHRRDRGARDVALATALAHCDVARHFLDARGSAEQAAAMLDAAARVLAQHRSGTPELVRQVAGAQAELRPSVALELLARPLGDAAARARGLALLPAVLAAAAAGGAPAAAARRGPLTRRQLLDRLRELLTAGEAVALWEAAGPAYASSPAELYEVAVAHLAAGAAGAAPARVARALDLLAAAEGAAASAGAAAEAAAPAAGGEATEALLRDRRAVDERQRRAVAAAACRLLLGSTRGAAEALGLMGPAPKCDRQVLAFVKANSPDKDDLGPGLCALAQRWVADVAAATFRAPDDVAAPGFSLDAWFEEPAVKRALAEGEARAAQGGALAAAGAALAAPFRALLASVLQRAPAREAADEAEAEAEAEEALPQVAAARVPPPARAFRREPAAAPDAAAALFEFAAAEEAGDAAPAPPPAAARAEDGAGPAAEFSSVPVGLEALAPLEGAAEDGWMRSAYEARTLRWGRLAGAAALLMVRRRCCCCCCRRCRCCFDSGFCLGPPGLRLCLHCALPALD
jgi:hypothetical protein